MNDELIELGKVISKYAPTLGMIVSTANPLAGLVISHIAQLFGIKFEEDSKNLITKINDDPEAEKKLKSLELNYHTLAASEIQDRGNARDREIKITKELHKRDYVMEGIAVAVVIGYFAMCSLTVFYSIPLADHDMLNMLFGQLMGGFMMVLSYYFGSSNK